ncbi:hypothetical protein P154DRAFT_526948 [Amniculicola lignicola CBS 123094]|uniref:Leo1-domain-containing protein n=1 Tax=Amniculicola lignicola CBS 123094 TaxID=1392246 RepID=A0A6A5WAG6_9PLEO|nr:hypothetical protein P154DRAFT_526948 [Amniculicola lignicola CBS 123094]
MASDGLSDDELMGAGKIGAVDSSDEDVAPRDTVEENGLDDDLDDDDLFGDGGDGGDDDEEQPAKQRQLDDEELDSGDDEGRGDRAAASQSAEPAQENMEYNFLDADIARHPVPEPSDGELYLFRVPQFLAIEPQQFSPTTFKPSTVDHHSRKGKPSDHFSAFDTAMTTIRWRPSPTNPAELQSNARILRWSDGSLTLQLASDPQTQYNIASKPLAPQYTKPQKPTPRTKVRNQIPEGFTYLVAPYEAATVMRITNHITTDLSVESSGATKDDALIKLQSDLAKVAKRGRDERDNAISFVRITEDPELVRQREEAAWKLREKKKNQEHASALKAIERHARSMGRSRGSGYGLNVGGLEGEEEGGRRPGVKKARAKTGLRRDWSDDEDYRGRTREDEYDEEDDFIAGSDEEPEIVEDDDEEEVLDTPSPKRSREEDNAGARGKRRRVVEDDDDE